MMRPSRPRRSYVAASVVFLVINTGSAAFFDRLVYGEWDGKGGDKLTQALNLIMIGLACWLFSERWRAGGRLLHGEKILAVLCGFMLLSVLWSVDPQTSFRRAVLYTMFVLGVCGMAGTLSGNAIMQVVRNLCLVCAVASLILYVVAPRYVVAYEGTAFGGIYDFRGIYSQKNIVGQAMAAGGLAALQGLRMGRQRLINAIALTFFFVTIVLSKSTTSLIVFAVLCAVSLMVVLIRRGGIGRVIVIVSVIIFTPIVMAIAISPDTFLSSLGKDSTLTGRTDIWALVLTDIYQRPILGWGLGAFWSMSNPAATAISDALGWVVPEAHSGLLESLLQVGGVGTCLFLFVFVRIVVVAVRCLRRFRDETAMTVILCSLGLLITSITEQILVDYSQFYTIILFVTGLSCERALRTHRQAVGRAPRVALRGRGPVPMALWPGR